MKIALIGDVHANLPALEAVLAHAYRNKVAAIWNVGDWVGYNAFPNELIQRLRDEGAVSIVGNYDLKILKYKKKKAKWQQTKHPKKLLAFKWAYENISKENYDYLRSLPKERELNIANKTILLTHGSPASNREPLTEYTPEEHLRKLAGMAKVDIIICGHSHQPFVRQVDEVWFINPGAVGIPNDGNPRASYAILEIDDNTEHLKIDHYRLEYDIDKAINAIYRHKLPEDFARMIKQGYHLNKLLSEK